MGTRLSDRVVLTYIERINEILQTANYTTTNRLKMLGRMRVEMSIPVPVLICNSLIIPENQPAIVSMMMESIITDYMMVFTPKDGQNSLAGEFTSKFISMLVHDVKSNMLASSQMQSSAIYTSLMNACDTAGILWVETPYNYTEIMETLSYKLIQVAAVVAGSWKDRNSKWNDVSYQHKLSRVMLDKFGNDVIKAYVEGLKKLSSSTKLSKRIADKVQEEMTLYIAPDPDNEDLENEPDKKIVPAKPSTSSATSTTTTTSTPVTTINPVAAKPEAQASVNRGARNADFFTSPPDGLNNMFNKAGLTEDE